MNENDRICSSQPVIRGKCRRIGDPLFLIYKKKIFIAAFRQKNDLAPYTLFVRTFEDVFAGVPVVKIPDNSDLSGAGSMQYKFYPALYQRGLWTMQAASDKENGEGT